MTGTNRANTLPQNDFFASVTTLGGGGTLFPQNRRKRRNSEWFLFPCHTTTEISRE